MKSRNAILTAVLLLAMSFVSFADGPQSREERRERRRTERAYRDSLRMAASEAEEINVGYGYAKRRNLTTSVSKVSIRQEALGAYRNIAEYLQGRVPGLIVQKMSGRYRYIIRGINTIYGSSDPLFVVDGAVVNDIDYLNPQSVKSVEILKDASASIYGSRGANGVILITTK